jgi:hypothetical protein
MTVKPYRYEVDLRMLPWSADAAALYTFCERLEAILEREGDDLVRVVPAFAAFNAGAHPCEGWPTERQWGLALREVFGIIPFPSAGERELRRHQRGRVRGGTFPERSLVP